MSGLINVAQAGDAIYGLASCSLISETNPLGVGHVLDMQSEFCGYGPKPAKAGLVWRQPCRPLVVSYWKPAGTCYEKLDHTKVECTYAVRWGGEICEYGSVVCRRARMVDVSTPPSQDILRVLLVWDMDMGKNMSTYLMVHDI